MFASGALLAYLTSDQRALLNALLLVALIVALPPYLDDWSYLIGEYLLGEESDLSR